MTTNISIPINKNSTVILLFFSLFFVLLGVWFVANAVNITRYPQWFLQVTGTIDILFFGYCAYFLAPKLFDTHPALTIDDEGIDDHTSAISLGRITWKEITSIEILTVLGQKMISIRTNNEKELLSRLSGFSYFMAKINADYFNSPISISTNLIGFDIDKLYVTLVAEWNKHK